MLEFLSWKLMAAPCNNAAIQPARFAPLQAALAVNERFCCFSAADGAAALVCHRLPGPPDAAAPGVVQGIHILRSLLTAAILSRRSVRLLKRLV